MTYQKRFQTDHKLGIENEHLMLTPFQLYFDDDTITKTRHIFDEIDFIGYNLSRVLSSPNCKYPKCPRKGISPLGNSFFVFGEKCDFRFSLIRRMRKSHISPKRETVLKTKEGSEATEDHTRPEMLSRFFSISFH